VVQSRASLSGVDAVFNSGISAYIINHMNRAKNEMIYGLHREKLGFASESGAFIVKMDCFQDFQDSIPFSRRFN
jgi:hypothetical protein